MSKISSDNLAVMDIVYSTSVDGVGLRNALYVSGCNMRCPHCHNQESWDINAGTWHTVEEVYEQLNIDYLPVSILGGEPLMQYEAVTHLCRLIKEKTGKSIWLWSGYTYEYIHTHFSQILLYVDVLVDGRYEHDLRDTSLLWRGSSNQRVIDVQKTINNKEVILMD